MKKILSFSLLFVITFPVFSYTSQDIKGANTLAQADIIVDKSDTPEKYRLDDTITRAEALGVALKLNGILLPEDHTCKGYYLDVTEKLVDNWVCRVVEVAALSGVISPNNSTFRPHDQISRAEAFAMIFNSSDIRGIESGQDFYFREAGVENWQKELFARIYDANLSLPNTLIEPEIDGITFPVDGEYDVFVDSFGWARSGGRRHEGTDIIAPKHTPLLAVADGRIEYAPHNEPSWGYVIYLKADDGYTYSYLHINNDNPGTDDGQGGPQHAYAPAIREGVRVRAGDRIAFLGDSGNAEWGGSHLHFEIHNPSGKVLNPYQTLVDSLII